MRLTSEVELDNLCRLLGLSPRRRLDPNVLLTLLSSKVSFSIPDFESSGVEVDLSEDLIELISRLRFEVEFENLEPIITGK